MAKFKYGGRSIHYFPGRERPWTACGRVVITGSVRVMEPRKYVTCRACARAVADLDNDK